ncbi:MAG: hypothetical protein ACREHF_14505, partial [Rhizomicrobium sp.]
MGQAAKALGGPRALAHCFARPDGENQPPDSSCRWMKVGGNVNCISGKPRLPLAAFPSPEGAFIDPKFVGSCPKRKSEPPPLRGYALGQRRGEVAGVSAQDLALPPPAEGSAAVAARVEKARVLQCRRYEGLGLRTNAQAEGELLDRVAAPEPAGAKLLTDAAAPMRLTARGYHRVLKVARTIADLAGSETVARIHIAEALSYRRMVHTRWLRKKPDGVVFLSRHRRAITWIANFCSIRFGVAVTSRR